MQAVKLREALDLISLGMPQLSRRNEAVELIASRIEALEAFAVSVRASPLADAIFTNVSRPGFGDHGSPQPAPGPSAASGERERCAKVCDDVQKEFAGLGIARVCAERIRALPDPAASGGRCAECRGKGAIDESDGRVAHYVTCKACHGTGATPEPRRCERLYPCDKCGKLRTKAQGGTTFTVCDECWDATHPKPQTGAAAEPKCEVCRDEPTIQNGPCPGCGAAPELKPDETESMKPLHWTGDGKGTAFAFGFGTVRACIDCGVLVTGGPTRCLACVHVIEAKGEAAPEAKGQQPDSLWRFIKIIQRLSNWHWHEQIPDYPSNVIDRLYWVALDVDAGRVWLDAPPPQEQPQPEAPAGESPLDAFQRIRAERDQLRAQLDDLNCFDRTAAERDAARDECEQLRTELVAVGQQCERMERNGIFATNERDAARDDLVAKDGRIAELEGKLHEAEEGWEIAEKHNTFAWAVHDIQKQRAAAAEAALTRARKWIKENLKQDCIDELLMAIEGKEASEK